MLITVIGILVTTTELTMASTFSKRTPGDLFHAVKDDPSLLATLPNTPRMALVPGGLPVVVDGTVVGAVSVGGGSTAQDVDCAQAGLRMLGARALGAA